MNQLRAIQKASSARRHIPVLASYTHLHAQRQPSNPVFLSSLNRPHSGSMHSHEATPETTEHGFSQPSLLSFLDPPSAESSSYSGAEYIISDNSSNPLHAEFKQVGGMKRESHPIFGDDAAILEG